MRPWVSTETLLPRHVHNKDPLSKSAHQKNLGTSRSVTLRARFQFGTRGAESTTNRRELGSGHGTGRIYVTLKQVSEVLSMGSAWKNL